MQFIIPKFIEKKAKIIGPFTFEQIIVLSVAIGISLFFYFLVPLATFIIAASFLLTVALSLIFIKIEKTPLLIVIKNLFIFTFKPKIYLWKKKTFSMKTFKRKRALAKPSKKKDDRVLKIAGQSRLKELSTRLETKSK